MCDNIFNISGFNHSDNVPGLSGIVNETEKTNEKNQKKTEKSNGKNLKKTTLINKKNAELNGILDDTYMHLLIYLGLQKIDTNNVDADKILKEFMTNILRKWKHQPLKCWIPECNGDPKNDGTTKGRLRLKCTGKHSMYVSEYLIINGWTRDNWNIDNKEIPLFQSRNLENLTEEIKEWYGNNRYQILQTITNSTTSHNTAVTSHNHPETSPLFTPILNDINDVNTGMTPLRTETPTPCNVQMVMDTETRNTTNDILTEDNERIIHEITAQYNNRIQQENDLNTANNTHMTTRPNDSSDFNSQTSLLNRHPNTTSQNTITNQQLQAQRPTVNFQGLPQNTLPTNALSMRSQTSTKRRQGTKRVRVEDLPDSSNNSIIRDLQNTIKILQEKIEKLERKSMNPTNNLVTNFTFRPRTAQQLAIDKLKRTNKKSSKPMTWAEKVKSTAQRFNITSDDENLTNSTAESITRISEELNQFIPPPLKNSTTKSIERKLKLRRLYLIGVRSQPIRTLKEHLRHLGVMTGLYALNFVGAVTLEVIIDEEIYLGLQIVLRKFMPNVRIESMDIHQERDSNTFSPRFIERAKSYILKDNYNEYAKQFYYEWLKTMEFEGKENLLPQLEACLKELPPKRNDLYIRKNVWAKNSSLEVPVRINEASKMEVAKTIASNNISMDKVRLLKQTPILPIQDSSSQSAEEKSKIRRLLVKIQNNMSPRDIRDRLIKASKLASDHSDNLPLTKTEILNIERNGNLVEILVKDYASSIVNNLMDQLRIQKLHRDPLNEIIQSQGEENSSMEDGDNDPDERDKLLVKRWLSKQLTVVKRPKCPRQIQLFYARWSIDILNTLKITSGPFVNEFRSIIAGTPLETEANDTNRTINDQ